MYQVQWHICEDNTDMKLQWNQIDWKKAEEQVNRLQIRIVKATLEQKLRLVKRLQYLITNSFYAKALAVKRVVSNRGKKTPGIDGEFWKTDEEKVNAKRGCSHGTSSFFLVYAVIRARQSEYSSHGK